MMLGVLVTGEIWLEAPSTILVGWNRKRGLAVSAKGMTLALCGRLGLDGGQYQAIQYAGGAMNSNRVSGENSPTTTQPVLSPRSKPRQCGGLV